MSSTQDLINYYANLLILQYIGKPKAYATIQTLVTPVVMPQMSVETISYSGIAASGTFVLAYNGNNSAAINWNDSLSTIQSKLQAVSGLGSVTVTGSIASELFTVTFTGITPPASLLTFSSNSLQTSGAVAIALSIAATDQMLPLAVQNAFNLTSAVGAQLAILGKYAGVTPNGFTFSGPITLNDTQFRALIQAMIARNMLQGDLSSIQALINAYFNGVIQVFDHQGMRMSYFYEAAIGANPVAEFFIKLGALPKPMGVQLATLTYAYPNSAFFGMRTYFYAGVGISPLNSYTNYQSNRPWLSYANGIAV
jgi:hypothetical protein